MNKKTIPGTPLEISRIALGTWPFAEDMWGPNPEKSCLALIDAALEEGINLIDTAPFYGQGRSEKIVGRAVKGRRDKVILATKCGLLKTGKTIHINLKPASIRRELDDSLKRLQTDYIDLYQTHWPDDNTPLEDTLSEMQKFKQEGKIRAIGVCNFDKDLLQRAADGCEVASVQNQYSALKRDDEQDMLPACEQKHIGYMAYGPLAGGILSGKYKKEPYFADKKDPRRFFYRHYKGDTFQKATQAVNALKSAADTHRITTAQAALAWLISHPAVTCAITGARTPDQIRMNAASADIKIPLIRDMSL